MQAICDADLKVLDEWMDKSTTDISKPICSETQRTALHFAAAYGKVEITKKLLQKGTIIILSYII